MGGEEAVSLGGSAGGCCGLETSSGLGLTGVVVVTVSHEGACADDSGPAVVDAVEAVGGDDDGVIGELEVEGETSKDGPTLEGLDSPALLILRGASNSPPSLTD